MPHLNEKHKEHRVEVGFCDTTTVERTYLDTAWGGIEARDDYRDFVNQGQENDKVWAKYPHVVKVSLHPVDSEHLVTDHFDCPCHVAERTG